jgi:tRNA nucleotidyltransferase (CCA-adding enzyme)
VRVLRVARFAARFKPFGFKVAHTTHQLMKQMVISGEVDALISERVFKELEKSLSYEMPSAFFKLHR